ncbi:MAG: hypothetical protein NZ580_01420 [Bacteroidia bacterium]|nr:hypothetical protein [Bacteroidia bacterium]MDW8235349.1 hypothetical protein [Bacteroidia bacterium]
MGWWLQLWIWSAGQVLPCQAHLYPPPLRAALYDVDSLLRVGGIRDTIELVEGPTPNIQLQPLSERCQLRASDFFGWAHALYFLLEAKHGFLFPHPKVILRIPPAKPLHKLQVVPRFRYRGFHLHTQHPIELTEALHTPFFPNAEAEVKAYIDWLARNRQNYFEFCLLRTVSLRDWVPYFRRIVAFARERGVEVGIDLSLRMQQQRAFQLLPCYSLKSRRKRLWQGLSQIASTGATHLNVELTSAEFVGKNWGRWIDTLLSYAKALGLQVMTRQHVVPPEAYTVGSFRPSQLPKEVTLCVHSVMCYGLQDTFTPVYRCKSFRHLYESLVGEKPHRRVWYYPETAYWVTFDNSVPVWLLSYLRSRLEDILLVEGIAEGHLTFSSGWDAGYWLFDWSVARWSWKIEGETPFPAEGLVCLFGGDTARWNAIVRFQDSLMVGRDVLSLITPTTPIDEISWNRLPPFQPRLPAPPWKIARRPERYRSILESRIEGMQTALAKWAAWNAAIPPLDPERRVLWDELEAAWEITRLRVTFRYYWLQALLHHKSSLYIDSLRQTLSQAQAVVKRLPVRYPHAEQARLCHAGKKGCQHPHPSYRFGYFFPARTLHFWERERGQVERGKWSVFYRNIWDIPRIIGLW